MHERLYRIVVPIFLALSLAVSGCSAGPSPLTPEQKRLNLESFDQVWTTVNEKHFDTTFGGVDWPAVHAELRPKMEQAATMAEARGILRDMLSRLDLSHFNIISAELYENIDGPAKSGDADGATGLDVRVVDNAALVTAVAEGTPAEAAGIRPGWEILAIDGEDIPQLLPPIAEEYKDAAKCEYYLVTAVKSRLRGAIGDSITVLFLDGDSSKVETTMPLAQRPGKKVIFGDMPPFYLTTRVDTLPDNVGYFAFSCFLDPAVLMTAFNGAMQTFMNSPGLIIDLRGNPGGMAMIGMGMAGWLVPEKNLYLGTLSTRGTQLRLVLNPRAQVFAGPVAVLVDGLSGSSSEILAGGLQDIGRARIFGSRTVGAALPSMFTRLPDGDGFQYAFADYVSAGGRVLEGRGVIPDVEVVLSRQALLAGHDPVIDAARQWIAEQNQRKE